MPLLLVYSSFLSAAPIPSIKHLAKINDITQDKDGYIWLSGHQGITRFDSINSITFSVNDPNWQVPFSWAHELEPYGDKFIAASETNGSWIFDPKTGSVQPINIQTGAKSHYHTIAFNDHFYTYSKLKVFQYKTNTGETSEIFNTQGTAFFAKTNHHLYMRTRGDGLLILTNNNFETIINEKVRAIVETDEHLVAITEAKIYSVKGKNIVAAIDISSAIHGLAREHNTNNVFTISDDGEIKKYQASTLAELTHSYSNTRKGRIKAAFHDSSNVLWLASNFGIETLQESSIKNHPIVFDIASNANELAVFQNELIIGSYGMGLHTFNPDSTVFPKDVNNQFSARGLRIMSVLAIEDNLYVATFDGIWRFNGADKSLKKLDFPNNNKLLLTVFHQDGLLYIGSNYEGLYIYDIKDNRIIDHVSKAHGLVDNEVIDIVAFDDGDIWLSTASGISIYNRHSKNIKNLPSQGPSKVISLVFADNKIFAATLGDGIFIYDRQGTLLSIIAKGIDFSYSQTINNEIWIGTAMGLYIVDPKTHQFNLMPNTERYSFSGKTQILDNRAYLNHYSGILEIPLTKPDFYNANVYIGKSTVSGQQFITNQPINISSASDVVTFDLASLDFRPGQAKQFRYRINDGSWNQVNSSHLTLTGLASGEYNIEVMATNSLGQWSSNKAFANIAVAYPWYWTLQARIIYVITAVCFLALSAWTFYLRTQSIRKIDLVLEAEIKRKGKSALLIQRNLQSIIAMLKEGSTSEAIKMAEQSIESFNEGETSDTPDSLYGNTLSVAIPYLAEYIHRKYHINLTFELVDSTDELNYELQSNLYKVIYEALSCAILHGDGRNFNLTIQEFKEKLWLTITDDESSFANFNNKVTFNMSMYYIRQIANKYSASVNTFEGSDDRGSQIVMSFPLPTK